MSSPPRSAALAALALAASCGWHAGLEAPPEVRTVGIEVFDNDTLEQDLEPRLAQALARSMTGLVDAEIVRPERADAVIRGRLSDYHRRMGARTQDNRLLETGVYVEIEAELVDRSSGQLLRRARTRVWSGYVLGDLEADRRAADRALEHLAERLVLDLFRPSS